jgi:hypothetical protein
MKAIDIGAPLWWEAGNLGSAESGAITTPAWSSAPVLMACRSADLFGLHRRDLLFGVAEFGQHFGAVFAEQR